MNRYIKKGGSGITLAYPEEPMEDAFRRFIAGSVIDGESMSGTSGFLLRYKNESLPPVYKSSDMDTYDEPVDTILVKFVPIRTTHDYINLESEIAIQNDVYNKTKDGLEPLCPAIVFSGIFLVSDQMIEDLKLDINDLSAPRDMGVLTHIGVIAMEFMQYTSMYDVLMKNPKYKCAGFMAAAFLLIELADKTGYTQGDFHFGNIFFKNLPEHAEYPYFSPVLFDIKNVKPFLVSDRMVDKVKRDLLLITNLKPKIIDFGRATRIDTSYDISQMYREHKFKEILASICAQGCYNIYYNYILKYPDFYGWASGSSKDEIVGNGAGLEDEGMDKTDLERLYRANLVKTQSYLEHILHVISNGVPLFFTNTGDTFSRCNMGMSERIIVNDNFDGREGIMSTLIEARNTSEIKILEAKDAFEPRIRSKRSRDDTEAIDGMSNKKATSDGGKRRAKNRRTKRKSRTRLV